MMLLCSPAPRMSHCHLVFPVLEWKSNQTEGGTREEVGNIHIFHGCDSLGVSPSMIYSQAQEQSVIVIRPNFVSPDVSGLCIQCSPVSSGAGSLAEPIPASLLGSLHHLRVPGHSTPAKPLTHAALTPRVAWQGTQSRASQAGPPGIPRISLGTAAGAEQELLSQGCPAPKELIPALAPPDLLRCILTVMGD